MDWQPCGWSPLGLYGWYILIVIAALAGSYFASFGTTVQPQAAFLYSLIGGAFLMGGGVVAVLGWGLQRYGGCD